MISLEPTKPVAATGAPHHNADSTELGDFGEVDDSGREATLDFARFVADIETPQISVPPGPVTLLQSLR